MPVSLEGNRKSESDKSKYKDKSSTKSKLTKSEKNDEKRTSKSLSRSARDKTSKKQNEREVEKIEPVKTFPISNSKQNTASTNAGSSKKSKIKVDTLPKEAPTENYNYEDNFEEYESDFEELDDTDSDARPQTTTQVASHSLLLKKLENRIFEPFPLNHAKVVGDFSSVEIQPTNRMIDLGSVKSSTFGNIGTTREKIFHQNTTLEHAKKKKFYEYFQQISSKNASKIEVFTQTGDNYNSDGTQMELPIMSSKGTQFPQIASTSTAKTFDFNQPESINENILESLFPLSRQRQLEKFLDIASKLVLNLISFENKYNEQTNTFLMQHNSSATFSSQYSIFNVALKNCKPCYVCFPITNMERSKYNNLCTVLCCVFMCDSIENSHLYGKSLLMEFDMRKPSDLPLKVLVCENEVTCCCYTSSSNGDRIVVAGLKDGSCVMWDLNEIPTCDAPILQWRESGRSISLLRPSFDSSFSSVIKENASNKSSSTFMTNGEIMRILELKMQPNSIEKIFATIHINGLITIWKTFNQTLNKSVKFALGVDPRARISLLKIKEFNCFAINISSQINKGQNDKNFDRIGKIQATCMEPINSIGQSAFSHHFLVGTTKSLIIHVKSSDVSNSVIRRYNSCELSITNATEISCISNSPYDEEFFAAGCNDSRILLYHCNESKPLRVLCATEMRLATPVTFITWALDTHHVLYAAYGSSYFAVWRLYDSKSKRPQAIDVCNFLTEFRLYFSSLSICSDPSENTFMAFALSSNDGKFAAYCLERNFERSSLSIRQLLIPDIIN